MLIIKYKNKDTPINENILKELQYITNIILEVEPQEPHSIYDSYFNKYFIHVNENKVSISLLDSNKTTLITSNINLPENNLIFTLYFKISKYNKSNKKKIIKKIYDVFDKKKTYYLNPAGKEDEYQSIDDFLYYKLVMNEIYYDENDIKPNIKFDIKFNINISSLNNIIENIDEFILCYINNNIYLIYKQCNELYKIFLAKINKNYSSIYFFIKKKKENIFKFLSKEINNITIYLNEEIMCINWNNKYSFYFSNVIEKLILKDFFNVSLQNPNEIFNEITNGLDNIIPNLTHPNDYKYYTEKYEIENLRNKFENYIRVNIKIDKIKKLALEYFDDVIKLKLKLKTPMVQYYIKKEQIREEQKHGKIKEELTKQINEKNNKLKENIKNIIIMDPKKNINNLIMGLKCKQ